METWIKKILEPRFSKIEVSYIEDQQIAYSAVDSPLINLDSELDIRKSYKFEISRLYDLFGSHRLGYTNRPGSKFLELQAKVIPAGQYQLFDDDIYTGNTVKYVSQFLKEYNIEITGAIALNKAKKDHTEILDARDFLFGINNSGLVLKCKALSRSFEVRMPYLYPYVCPYIRASIQDPLEFSLEMWDFNRQVHEVSKLRLGDKPELCRLFGEVLDFGEETRLSEICYWHYQKLKNHCSVGVRS